MSLRAVDFVRPASPPICGWLLLAVGAAAFLAATIFQQRWASEVEAQRREAEARMEFSRASLRPSVAAPPTPAQRRLQKAQEELNRPWISAFEAVESVTADPVYLLSMNFERGSDVLRLEAEATSFEDALAYVQRLAQTDPLRDATLVSHEQANNPGGLNVVRFSVVTRWTSK